MRSWKLTAASQHLDLALCAMTSLCSDEAPAVSMFTVLKETLRGEKQIEGDQQL